MEAKAVLKYASVSPQKARLVVDLIRGKMVDEALATLDLNTKAVSKVISTIVQSAVANAENTKELDIDKLYVKRVFVDAGPTQKRMRPRAMGRGNQILKRSSHITVVLEEQQKGR
ncbi:MAG: 50S ribosomal protein L22 [Deltaproteobacteria bacterium]|nr:50S ribosomal protein L22 [Deltaproteobacteria bacterium]